MTPPAENRLLIPDQVYDTILVLDFGSQYSHLITRRIRELGVYCELLPCTVDWKTINFVPKGIILSGGPASVYEDQAPHVSEEILTLGIPILGICYGLQEMAWKMGGKVIPCVTRGYGTMNLDITHQGSLGLFQGLPKELVVWMSHGDQLSELPQGFNIVAVAKSAPYAAIANEEKKMYGIQFHPEVTHTQWGKEILKNFAVMICHCRADWTMASFVDKEIERIRSLVGEKGLVVGAISGGVDSTVAAVLMDLAIGDRFHGILVDHGLMRLNETEKVNKRLKEKLKINLKTIHAADLFLSRLSGVTDPEKKRKIIGNTFIEVFEKEAKELGNVDFLLQGTLYPDVIESISYKGPSATIKTHHNVGGLLGSMQLKLIEPLRELFKDEVRQLGKILGLDDELVWRHPFPGPGLAIRILGEVTPSQVKICQHADAIYMEEIKKAGLYRSISQAYAALLPVRSVGVMGDQRTYEQVIALRAVETTDFMTADWFNMPYEVLKVVSSRIINEVKGVNRVVYDISSKPPSTIEWE